MSSRGEALRAKYGVGQNLGQDSPNVFVWGHKSQEAAEAFVAANQEDGFDSRAEQRDGQWVSVVDLNPYLNSLPKVVGP